MDSADETVVEDVINCARAVATTILDRATAREAGEALNDLRGVLDDLVEAEADFEIDLAMGRLQQAASQGDQVAEVARMHAQVVLKLVVLQHQTPDGQPLELALVPVALPCDLALVPTGPYRELLDAWSDVREPENLHFVDPRLWPAELVFGLGYLDIASLNPEEGLTDPWPDTPDEPKEGAALRFLAIWRYAPEDHDNSSQELVDTLTSGDQDKVDQAITEALENSLDTVKDQWAAEQAAAQETARILGEMLDGTTAAQVPADPLEARTRGWGMREALIAEQMLFSQLNLTSPVTRATGESTVACMVYSLHGEPTPPELGEGWVPGELRLSLLDQKGTLIARHAIRLAPWYQVEDALGLAQELTTTLGIDYLNGVAEPQDLADDRPGEPLYFQGRHFLPHTVGGRRR